MSYDWSRSIGRFNEIVGPIREAGIECRAFESSGDLHSQATIFGDHYGEYTRAITGRGGNPLPDEGNLGEYLARRLIARARFCGAVYLGPYEIIDWGNGDVGIVDKLPTSEG